MPSINLDLDYFTHPKTMRLIGMLGKGTEVLPIRLWCWCAKYHAESGKLASYSTLEIESILGWWGKEGLLVDAFLKLGFLEKVDDGFLVHDFLEHQGHVAALKERAKKGAKARWDKLRDDATSNATSNAQASSKQCSIPPIQNIHTEGEPPPGKRAFGESQNVFLTEIEYDNLVLKSGGKEWATECIELLSAYKVNNKSKVIQSDYHYIVQWVLSEIQRRKKEHERIKHKSSKNNGKSSASERAGFEHGEKDVERIRNMEATLANANREWS
jgi:hypothetical protein